MEQKLTEIYNTSPYLEFKNKTKFDQKVIGSDVYGEITEKGTDMIVNRFKEYFNPNTIFYDLGSGLSKMVIHIGMKYNVKESIGIEYSKERHQGALFLKENYAKEYDNIKIYCKSFLNHDLSNATVVYMDNTVYPDDINTKIYEKLSKGCLIIYKKKFRNISENQVKVENGTERTYRQNYFYWIIKE